MFRRFAFLILLLVPSALVLHTNVVRAQDDDIDGDLDDSVIQNDDAEEDTAGPGDAVEGEDDEATVETDEPEAPAEGAAVTETEQAEEAEEDKSLKPSPDADVTILFTKPVTSTDLPGGDVVSVLVGFSNKGESDLIVQSISASLRYPQDFTYFIQNFSDVAYAQTVKSKEQASFDYSFSPSEALHSRPFGLTILIGYKDTDDNLFENTLFNETINIVETSEGLDGETFFLYIFLFALVALLSVGAYHLFKSYGIKRPPKPKPVVEMGTQKNTDVDYDWIPKETIQHLNRSPGRSPKQSPTTRRTKRKPRSAGED